MTAPGMSTAVSQMQNASLLLYNPRPTPCDSLKKSASPGSVGINAVIGCVMKSTIQWLKTTSPMSTPVLKFRLQPHATSTPTIDQTTDMNRPWDQGPGEG